MKKRVAAVLAAAVAVAVGRVATVAGCSTTVVGKAASATGAVFASHSNDGDGGEAGHLRRVPAKDWAPNATRSVNKGASIPQVPHTFAYHTEGYAAMNEHQVGLAESTCYGQFSGGPHGIVDIVQLGQIALERASSSRQAVLVMGSLAEQYGYDDSAESLIVTDKDEAFIFQIMPDDTATSALWVAQRVPDNHVGVVTNGLTVREVDFEDGSAFLSSSNLRPIAKAKGWWIEGTPFDFTRIFGAAGMGSQYGVGRRMWSAYRLLAPNQEFPSHYNDFINDAPYPATAMTTKKVGLQDVMRVMRDYYQNTSFDMTQGMAAGPFGTPDRWGKGPGEKDVNGTWERTIAIYRSIVTLVLESRSWLPDPVGGTLWFAPHAAHTSTYAPFPCGMDAIPDSYGNASGWGAINRGVAAWANRYVFNMAQLRFSDAIVDVAAARSTLDNASLALQAASDKAYVAAPSTATMVAVSKAFAANADGIVAAWWKLADEIVVKYADGGGHRGYPAWWLASKDVGYTTPL